jgi:Tfp pilus tip-associated adhesin PilY1
MLLYSNNGQLANLVDAGLEKTYTTVSESTITTQNVKSVLNMINGGHINGFSTYAGTIGELEGENIILKTVGTNETPIYLNNGSFLQSTHTLANLVSNSITTPLDQYIRPTDPRSLIGEVINSVTLEVNELNGEKNIKLQKSYAVLGHQEVKLEVDDEDDTQIKLTSDSMHSGVDSTPITVPYSTTSSISDMTVTVVDDTENQNPVNIGSPTNPVYLSEGKFIELKVNTDTYITNNNIGLDKLNEAYQSYKSKFPIKLSDLPFEFMTLDEYNSLDHTDPSKVYFIKSSAGL